MGNFRILRRAVQCRALRWTDCVNRGIKVELSQIRTFEILSPASLLVFQLQITLARAFSHKSLQVCALQTDSTVCNSF